MWNTPLAEACSFTKSNTPPWVFFTFFKLHKLYQIALSVTYSFDINHVIGPLRTHYKLDKRHFWRKKLIKMKPKQENCETCLLFYIYLFLCVKSVSIRSYSSPYSVRMRENADQNNFKNGHFLRSVCYGSTQEWGPMQSINQYFFTWEI